jgi:hypothetical protein
MIYDEVAQVLGQEEWSKLCATLQGAAKLWSAGVLGIDGLKTTIMDRMHLLRSKLTEKQWQDLKEALKADIQLRDLVVDTMGYVDGQGYGPFSPNSIP